MNDLSEEMSTSLRDIQALGECKLHVAPVSPTGDSKAPECMISLESCGDPIAMTRILMEMYEKKNKPSYLLPYFIQAFGALCFQRHALRGEIQDLKSVVINLEQENKALREKLESQ